MVPDIPASVAAANLLYNMQILYLIAGRQTKKLKFKKGFGGNSAIEKMAAYLSIY